ncbi:AdoMet-dependent rRNA methyltransferase SPB1 [Apostasia shenzhenica]|uniref:Putative rRNA methyltransferase n=1 Tax=Apostasia shenzhenica TaxID=1088818 RepID=A0A2I0AAJ4_9ASPA|nr:AdoMet-dependent rRNA methyltransferase SPB1 [Apostasia shenzhenica]
MGKTKKGKDRLDKFYHLAKEQGYRSRAAFKLLQLDAKFRFLPSARAVLDLCAAPGGWLQVVVRHVPVGSFILGVDLVPIRPIRGVHSIAEDITTQRCRAAIRRLMDSNGIAAFDVVLHDGSPKVGAAWGKDAALQSSLVVDSIRLATNFLAPNGIFLTKVFRSQDYSAIIFCLKQLFMKVEVTKPVASRSTSAEIYVIAQRYKAPAKIDPRLLDVKHLFQGSIEQPKVIDVLRGSKQKRNREGYEEGNTTLWKVGKVSDFVWSEAPLEFLGSVNALSFDDSASLNMKAHEITTDEIKSLCGDLYVLDKNSFKHLLKWRMQMRKALSTPDPGSSKVAEAEREMKGNEDEHLLSEMEELTHALDRKKKKAKKLLAKRRAKDKARKALGLQVDATEDSCFDRELFSLSTIKGKKDLEIVESASDDEGDAGDSASEAETAVAATNSLSDLDSDEEKKRYDEQLDEILDEAYERYVTRKGGSSSTKQRKRAKLSLSTGDAELLEDGDGEDIPPGHDFVKDQDELETNPLVVPLDVDEKPTQEQIMEQWFSQDVFAAAGDELLDQSDSEDDEEEPETKLHQKAEDSASSPQNSSPPQILNLKKQDDFEIVPTQPLDDESDDSSSDEESEEDEDTKAEILACAKKMLRRKQREEILDDAYNRYMFDDEGLPKWFVEEEKRHCQPLKPVTKEEVAAMRAQFREIDARPAKKVAEAKARKKRAAMKKLEKARKKADAISDQTDISERSKGKMIDQLYKKAAPKRPKKEYVVAKKGVQVRAGKGKVLVDRRMKKDMRTHGMGKPGKKGRPVQGKGSMAKGKKAAKGKKPIGKRNAGKGGKKGSKME